jgi:hypothetical protein
MSELVFLRKLGDHFRSAGRVLIHEDRGPSVESAAAESFSVEKHRSLSEEFDGEARYGQL